MAQAPCNKPLYEACKAALAWHEGWDHQNCVGFGDDERDEVIRKLQAAIAKAEREGNRCIRELKADSGRMKRCARCLATPGI